MITLISGGARSGKSKFAEEMLKDKNEVVYIATSRIWDEEMQQRVNLHRNRRNAKWRTFEGTYNLKEAVGNEKYYLLDCLTNLISNIMFDITEGMEKIDEVTQKKIEEVANNEIKSLIDEVNNKNGNLIMVTNETGMSIVPENHIARVFRDIQGRINQMAAQISDEVYIVFLGIPLKLK
ncbi:Bifunctional adenosylcobalamin biosynthesis protein CobU [Caloramator mitchellensis]|uniref:Adenosylcobinamide kinase n=1 Tax=Caloramator mitchellensis TaxID=908809 RepID=A0A0R3JR33_CALMK|nr:bifunctional adenosylcobinamide kinase/adenosylcobinamide-phosphate guanylyltransferase [Caloramator mitchellensis]KRQ85931.1 Bifunctional adenosylcobalamin biosynthesis protein CobU [Caloramator mitchellensis]